VELSKPEKINIATFFQNVIIKKVKYFNFSLDNTWTSDIKKNCTPGHQLRINISTLAQLDVEK